MFFDAAC